MDESLNTYPRITAKFKTWLETLEAIQFLMNRQKTFVCVRLPEDSLRVVDLYSLSFYDDGTLLKKLRMVIPE